jgi:hypothetical protein
MKSMKDSGARFNPWQNILSRVEEMGVIEDEDEEVRLQKSVLVVTAMWIGRIVGESSMAVMLVHKYLNTV